MQVVYVKIFIETEGNKLQDTLLESIDGRTIAQRIIKIILFGYSCRGKRVFKQSIFHLYYEDFFNLSQRAIIT